MSAHKLGTRERASDSYAATLDDIRSEVLTPQRLNTLVTLQRRGRTATLPPWAVLRHLVNHTTYHRGQVASKLKRFGIQQPETDLVYWVFEQVPPQK